MHTGVLLITQGQSCDKSGAFTPYRLNSCFKKEKEKSVKRSHRDVKKKRKKRKDFWSIQVVPLLKTKPD